MRRLVGVLIGLLLFFPGAMVLQWLAVDELGLYERMSLTDALLVIIIILACVIILGQPRRPLTSDELEEQARRMELASRRLEQAQRRLRSSRLRTPRTARSRSGSDRSRSRERR